MRILRESMLLKGKDSPKIIEKCWTKGYKEYCTILKDTKTGLPYVTNRFDPRVVTWCKGHNVVPRGE